MNVIIVYDFAYVNGGAAGVAIAEALALAEENYPVTFFSAVGPVDSRLLESSVDVICLHQQELKAQLGGPASKIKGAIQGMVNREAVSRLSSLLKGFDPKNTIVHVHGCTLALSPAIFTAIKKHHFKVALTCHDYELNCPTRTYFDYKAGAMCTLRGMSAQCVCTNCDKRSRMQKLYRVLREYMLWRFIKGSDLSLIYLSEFNKDIMERDLHFKCNGYIVPNVVNIPPKRRISPASNHRFLFVGRLNPEKGVELFCEAVTRAGVEADVIGDGELYESMREKYPNVTFHGWKTQEEMVSIIQKARCFIMSSICYDKTLVDKVKAVYPDTVHIPYIPAPSHLEITSHAHIGIVFYKDDSLNRAYCAPNKIYEYAHFGIPMIGNRIPGLQDTVGQAHAAECIDMTAEQIFSAIRKIESSYAAYSRSASQFFADTDNYAVMQNILRKCGIELRGN